MNQGYLGQVEDGLSLGSPLIAIDGLPQRIKTSPAATVLSTCRFCLTYSYCGQGHLKDIDSQSCKPGHMSLDIEWRFNRNDLHSTTSTSP